MRYTPEHHLDTAKARELQAKAEKNLERREALSQSAQRHRLVAKAGLRAQEKQQTPEQLPHARITPDDEAFDEAFDQAFDEILGLEAVAEGNDETGALGAEPTTNANLGYQFAVTSTLRVFVAAST